MYKFNDFKHVTALNSGTQKLSFVEELKSKWTTIHKDLNVFRYKLDDLQEKRVGKYLIMLNPDRGSKRRLPQDIITIKQPFDDNKFNFTKISSEEIMFSIDCHGDEQLVVVNVSPISRYHTLLCPSVKMKLPQVATAESLQLTLEIMFLDLDRELKIVYNSLCGFASVNHLHYHLMFYKDTLPVELAIWKQLKGPLYIIQDYPVDTFCFQIDKEYVQKQVADMYKVIQYLLDNSVAHNILMTTREDGVAVFIFPRKSATGIKSFGDFNVAALELSGWIIVYSSDAFETFRPEHIETELKKWKLNNFEELSKKIQELY